eukprot:14872743-Alexandrium_andersonii.AAC.1
MRHNKQGHEELNRLHPPLPSPLNARPAHSLCRAVPCRAMSHPTPLCTAQGYHAVPSECHAHSPRAKPCPCRAGSHLKVEQETQREQTVEQAQQEQQAARSEQVEQARERH